MITLEEFLSLGLDNDNSYGYYLNNPDHEIVVLDLTFRNSVISRNPDEPAEMQRLGNFATQEEAEQVALTLRLFR